jgi:hypothetical protein
MIVVALRVDDAPSRGRDWCSPARALEACDGGDAFECAWGRLLAARGSVASLQRVIDGDAADLDSLLRRLFPAIGDKTIVDEPLPVPPGLVFDQDPFGRYTIPVPVDWSADPFQNRTWRLYFQSFHWFAEYSRGDLADVEAGAALITDWVQQALYADPPLDSSWGDHSITIRLDRTAQLVDRYITDRPVLNRRFLHAAAQVIVTHLYALSAACCYSPRHNHGTMEDLALLTWAPHYPALRDGARMFEVAGRRLLDEQVHHSVTADGYHVENSGCYHLLYVQLINGAIDVYRSAGTSPPPELVRVRDSMIAPLVAHVQPDQTFPHFGDCEEEDVSGRLSRLLAKTRELDVGDPQVLAPLEWIVSAGARGTAPGDQVFETGGYATFRDPTGAAAHFKTSHLSPVHYHADETGFEVFAHGRALLVQAGTYTYEDDDPLFAYQRSPAAHNVLAVDDDATIRRRASDAARILAHGVDGDIPWVQGTHANYRRLGVASLVRTFAFAKPDTFIVIDHVAAFSRHRYSQHFHLTPDVAEIQRAGDRSVLATIAGGPSLSITAASAPDRIETPRGVQEGARIAGWYFPKFLTQVPAYEVTFESDAGNADLATVIVVTAPGEPVRVPEDVRYSEEQGTGVITWVLDGTRRQLRVPAR